VDRCFRTFAREGSKSNEKARIRADVFFESVYADVSPADRSIAAKGYWRETRGPHRRNGLAVLEFRADETGNNILRRLESG